ncbi:MAG: AfsR/SARP family transcriptional regulator [Burkholderiales bacterium]
MNARWERRTDTDRELADLCAATLPGLRAGEAASVRDLIVGAHRAAGAEDDPIVAQLVEAARRLAAAWNALRDRADRRERALPEARDRPARFAGQVHLLPTAAAKSCGRGTAPALAAYVLGPFRALVNGQPIEDWPNCRGKAIFKYLLLNRRHPVAKEALMELFWPEAEPEAARNNLHVAMHRLRRALGRGDGEFPFVLFSGGHYLLNPKLQVSTDADAFLGHVARGGELERNRQVDAAMQEYAAGVALYQGELLAENRYDEWLLPLRQQLRDGYLHALDRLSGIHFDRQDFPSCTATCARTLAVDACNEGAHRMLMRCYARLGQPQLAQRQYRSYIHVLNRELGIPASAETTDLYRQIVRRHDV